jgi:hypothetical protein
VTIIADVWPTARKSHQCTVCLGDIAPGERYRRVRFIYDGGPEIAKEHVLCSAAVQQAIDELGLGWDEYPDFHEDVAPIIREVLSLAFPGVAS